jgi:hypothetical protein
MAARSARAAACDAGNRYPQQHIGRRLPHHRVPPGFERSRICRESDSREIEEAFVVLIRDKVDGLVVGTDPF